MKGLSTKSGQNERYARDDPRRLLETSLSDYALGDVLHHRPERLVIRGRRNSDGLSVVIKARLEACQTADDRRRAQNEFTILRALTSEFFPRAIGCESLDVGTALIMEEMPGSDLEALIHATPFNLAQALSISVQLAAALVELHEAHVVHKDIKPANIVLNLTSGRLALIDFAAATMLPREAVPPLIGGQVSGTAAYMSPEQTGRTNRGLDERSDLYSVGVTLYQLFAGRLPFEATDPLTMVYAHVAQRPPRLDEVRADLPPVLANIVARLLEKNAEDRYQTASALLADLTTCRANLTPDHQIESFTIAVGDRSRQFRMPEKLYGRDGERQTLIQAFERVAAKDSEAVLIAGRSGIGKTALVNELQKLILRQRGLFLRGKFDQFNRNVPFSALGQALDALARQWLVLDDATLDGWRSRLDGALGSEGRLILEMAPALAPIVGEQPQLPTLSAAAAKQRLKGLFLRVLTALRQDGQPLVLFLDDLQWADQPTLELLETVSGQIAGLLFIGAYRANEVDRGHPLLGSLQAMERNGCPLTRLTLAVLKESDLIELVADALDDSLELATPLARLLQQRTGGNPFFVAQMLSDIHRQGLIGTEAGRVSYDIDHIQATVLTDDVVEFMMGRLSDQRPETQQTLGLAACLGNRFKLMDLATASALGPEELSKALWPALREGLVLPECDGCGRPDLVDLMQQADVGFRFLHDRVQQAAYELIPADMRAQNHWMIGERWWCAWEEVQRDSRVFELAAQLNHKRDFSQDVEGETWRWRVIDLNRRAGLRAKEATAFSAATKFFEKGRDLASDDAWSDHYLTMYGLFLNGSEVAFLNGDFALAEDLYPRALAHADGVLDRAKIFRVQATQFQLQGRNHEALDVLRTCLAELGWDIPSGSAASEQFLDREIDVVRRFVDEQGVGCLADYRSAEDSLSGEMLRLLQIAFYAAWRAGETPLALLALTKMTTLSIERGVADLSPFGFVGFGLVATVRLKDYDLAFRFGEIAVGLCERFDDPDVTGMTNYIFAADVLGWSRPLRETEPYYEAAYRSGLEAGNHLTVGFMMQQSGAERLAYGRNLHDLLAIANDHAAFLRQIGNVDNLSALRIAVLQPIRSLQGQTTDHSALDDDQFSEAAFLEAYADKPYYLAWYHASCMRLAILWQQRDRYETLVDKLAFIEAKVPSHANKVPASVFHAGLMAVALAETDDPERRAHYRRLALNLLDRLVGWAEACPSNVRHKRLLLDAEVARLDGNKATALDLYDEAIDAARNEACWHELALANEHAGRFLLSWGKTRLAQPYLRDAHDGYLNWGATAKAEDVRTQFLTSWIEPEEACVRSSRSLASSTQGSESSSASFDVTLDLSSILKAAHALSQHQKLEQLLDRIIGVIAENAGADRGYLYVLKDGEWSRAASCDLGEDGPVFDASSTSMPDSLEQTLVRYAVRSREQIIVDRDRPPPIALDRDDEAGVDRASRLVIPALNQGELIAVVYLENSLTSGVFSDDRLDVLGFLTTQAAIALQNGRLFSELQDKTIHLEEAFKKEQELTALQRQFVSMVCHEFRTPLSIIDGNAQRILKRADTITPDRLRSILTTMRGSVERLIALIETVLNAAHLEEGRIKSEPENCDVAAAVNEVAIGYQEAFPRHVIEAVMGGSMAPFIVDGSLLRQIISHLLSNALKYSPEGSITQVSAHIHDAGHLLLSVRDNGPGIPEAECSRLFDKFFRGTTSTGIPGSGIGLHLVRAFVDLHDGEIDLESTVGEGTIVTITIPRQEHQADVEPATAA